MPLRLACQVAVLELPLRLHLLVPSVTLLCRPVHSPAWQVRLAWHAAGTYDKTSGTGGSDGATMRFTPECEHAANAGLKVSSVGLRGFLSQALFEIEDCMRAGFECLAGKVRALLAPAA